MTSLQRKMAQRREAAEKRASGSTPDAMARTTVLAAEARAGVRRGPGRALLVLSLLFNVVLVVLVVILMTSVDAMQRTVDGQQTQLDHLARGVDACYKLSLRKFGVYTDRGGIRNGVILMVPEVGSEKSVPEKVVVFPLESFIEGEGEGAAGEK